MIYSEDHLGNYVNFSNGRSSPDRTSDGLYPVYGSNGLIGFSDRANAPTNTSVIGRVGSYCGSIHFSAKPCWITDNAIVATAKSADEAHYWYYAMLNRNLHDLRAGSGQPLINQTALKAVLLPVPPKEQRVEIAAVLGALDDKIELNRKTAAVLEEMARALYRSWFVDFDPVWAKAEGRPPAHMDPATAALFPAGFDDDGLPLGWAMGTLADLARLNPETYSKKTFPDCIDYVDLSNTKWGVIEATTHYEWAAAPSRARMVLRRGDVIVGTVRPGNGSYSYVGRDGLTGSTGFAVLRPQKPENSALLYLAATDSDTIDELANLADGGAYPAVRPEVVAGRSVAIAASEIQHAFSEQTMPLIVRVEAFKAENQTLATLRDSLLPRLMSGELRFGAAREMLDEVA